MKERSIQPASNASPSTDVCPLSKVKKRQMVKRACDACRKIKCKCDGNRPSCARCLQRGVACLYDTNEGMSKLASLRLANEVLHTRLERHKQLFRYLLDDDVFASNGVQASLSPGTSEKADYTSDQSSAGHVSTCDSKLYEGEQERSDTHPPASLVRRENDLAHGGISGNQAGWHSMLVVMECENASTSDDLIHSPEHEFRSPSGDYTPLEPHLENIQLDRAASSPSLSQTSSQETPAAYPKNWQCHTQKPNKPSDNYSRRFSGVVKSFGNLPMSSALSANGYPPSIQRRQILNLTVPEHSVPPLLIEEDSNMSRWYIDFKDAALKLIGDGVSATAILGDQNVVHIDLFLRDRLPSDPYNVCNWACELVKNIPEMDVFVQLAWIALLTRFMQWIILPTAENYARIPPMMKPTPAQRLIPHSPALDLCPHPDIRNALMDHYRDWITPIQMGNGGMACWEGSLDSTVALLPAAGGMILTKNFQQHTRVKDNWTIEAAIDLAFPEVSASDLRVRNGADGEND